MRAYLNAWALELPPWDSDAILGLGFSGVRFFPQPQRDASQVRASCDFLAAVGLRALLLVNGGDMALSEEDTLRLGVATAHAAKGSLLPLESVAIEIGNEPDISPRYKGNPQAFGRLVDRVAAAIFDQVPGVTVVSGGVLKTSADGIGYLGEAARQIRRGVKIGVHSYRQTQGALGASRPYRTRTDEFQAIRSAVRGEPIWCTELGWHTASFPLRFCMRRQWTDDQVLGFLRDELALQAAAGTEVATIYQWTDGPQHATQGIDCFGLRRFGVDELKPQARCLEGADWRT